MLTAADNGQCLNVRQLSVVLELLLGFTRGAAFDAAHEVTDRDLGRNFDGHVDMIGRQDPADDCDVHFSTDLLDDFAHPKTALISGWHQPTGVRSKGGILRQSPASNAAFAFATTRSTSLLSQWAI